MRRERAADAAASDDDTLRARWEMAQAALRERFDEPIGRATDLTRRTLAWFPIRVWRHFLQHNGFLLAAGISYQSLFTIFAGIYLAAAVAGLWLGGDAHAVDGLIDLINGYIPNLISEEGLITPSQVEAAVAQSGGSIVTITGLVALVVVVWTAIGFVTYARRAVRDTFGLEYDRRSYLMLKARDLLAAFLFGVALVLGWALVQMTLWALDLVFSLVGWGVDGIWSTVAVRTLTMLVAFGINAVALALLFRFLTGTSLRWRRIWPGSLLGGAALAVLQLAAGVLLVYSPSNPLLATFAIFIGFMLWFRLNGIVILVAAAWIALATRDRDLPLVELSEAERLRQEYDALHTAARVRLREARLVRDTAPWWRRPLLAGAVRRAEDELARIEAAPPPPAARGLLR
ncbi:MAG: YihY/virulence factor BrkB family protein [Microbacterium sp.]|uniref:YihY/virulence factor BrkB family protein n=1 Tax=Microbacterium sp. TaxID=51671 RepID=UPI0039E66D89